MRVARLPGGVAPYRIEVAFVAVAGLVSLQVLAPERIADAIAVLRKAQQGD
ncbi:hypothetical protein [Streptomyces sp. NPDC002287]